MGIEFTETFLKDVYKIDYSSFLDKRGIFTKIFSQDKFKEVSNFNIKQVNISSSYKKGSFRGLHYQSGRFAEKKIVFCLKGKIMDFIVNVDKKSDEYLKVLSIELSSKKKNGLLIPASFAHGFITLEQNTTIIYLHDKEYNQKKENGICYNDPSIKIKLPIKISSISEKDKNYSYINSKQEKL